MSKEKVLVTGASGFVGRYVVKALVGKGYQVVAGIHSDVSPVDLILEENVQISKVDILDRTSVRSALKGVDFLFHFAALVDSESSNEFLYEVNVEGTRIVWESAVANGIKKALYCSTTAVYGLLAKSDGEITEYTPARAIEPYGRTKLQGEKVALEIAYNNLMHTIIIRPVAIFGPGEHTPFGRKFRDAAVSKLLIAGAFNNKSFNYVQVNDVAKAAIHLMELDLPSGEIYNIAVEKPILFEDAFSAYLKVLKKLGRPFLKVKIMAAISFLLNKFPTLIRIISKTLGERFLFTVWHPGFDLNYSSSKLLDTSFKFSHTDFAEVFHSCIESK